MGRYDDAAEHYLIGFRLHEELGENPLARGDAIECLVDVARVTGDWHRAITLYTDAQRAFRSVLDGLVGMTNTAHSLGETRLALHDVDGARIDYGRISRCCSTTSPGMLRLTSHHRSSRNSQRSFRCYGA